MPVRPVRATVSGRRVFYNNSAFDGRDPAAAEQDLAAVAPDKRPLLPGGRPEFANVTGYLAGVNGIPLDLAGAPPATLGAADFEVHVSRGGAAPWTGAPPVTVTRLPDPAGPPGARYALTWPDGAIVNQWVRVTVKASERTGLARPDVFAFGNLAGETGDAADAGFAVTARDALSTRLAPRATGVGPGNRHDHNRDGAINVLDYAAARRGVGRSLAPPSVLVRVTGGAEAVAPPTAEIFRVPARPERRPLHIFV